MNDKEFDLSLIARLRYRHPDVDIDRIADEVAADPDVRNVNAMLTSRVRQAASQPKPPPPQDKPPGGFNPDGTWNPNLSGRDSLTRFVWMTCTKRRRDPSFSPADAQRIIDDRGFTAAFDHLAAAQSWPSLRYTRSSSQAVKHMGYGGSGCDWNPDGQWLPKHVSAEAAT